MTPEEFNAALAKTKLSERSAKAARLVLVDGLGFTQAGNAITPRMTRMQVYDVVSRVEREHLRTVGAPPGWKCLTLALPYAGEEWDAAEELQRRAYKRAGLIK